MNNKLKIIGLIHISIVLISCIGCQPAVNGSNSQLASNTAVANQSATSNPTPAPAASPASAEATGSLATPSDTYRTAHELRKNKDVAGLKKIMAPDMIEFLTMIGEEEKKTLDDMVKEMFQKPQADRAEVRNEKIKGELATVEYLTETGAWKVMDFQKIDNQWKIDFPKPDKASE